MTLISLNAFAKDCKADRLGYAGLDKIQFRVFFLVRRDEILSAEIIEIDTAQVTPPQVGDDLYVNRTAIVEMQQEVIQTELSIMIQAYNRIEKIRRCVESVLAYTKSIDYELILIDNGSNDGTFEFFRSVQHDKKKIIRVTKNIGSTFPSLQLNLNNLGPFFCSIPDDFIATPRWMENLLTVIKSDPKIGMVNGVSANTSNLQDVGLTYRSYEEMQEKAAQFNRISDPRKWEDRQRLITVGPLFRKEALFAIGFPMFDVGFFHDFGDDDVSFRVRRAGYRTVLAGDTWVCHDHNYSISSAERQKTAQESIEIGRANFRKKYFDVDAWEDVNNYYIPYMERFPKPKIKGIARILGIDVRCGTPILDIKNWLRKHNIYDAELSAFVQNPKYWIDLKTICQGSVLCDREEFLSNGFPAGYFDYVIADRPLNRYHEPQKLINDLFLLCKDGGTVTCKLKNTFSFQEYVHLLGQWGVYDSEFSYHIPLESVQTTLEKLGSIQAIIGIPFPLSEDQIQALKNLLPKELPKETETMLLNRMLCKEYLLITQKKSGIGP